MIGKQLSHYEIIGLLGKGGMGEVYRARDKTLEREVALKVLPEPLEGDHELLARFSREAKLLASFNHPNIAAIHELGKDQGRHFLVMELVEGRGLDELVSGGSLSLEEIRSIFGQIAQGLEFAHERGILHRDLKPANVKVTSEGQAKILDFGLGKILEPGGDVSRSRNETVDLGASPSSLRTMEGRILGTPAYMSPEQARGQPLDKRTDIWAFGCCLYEALTGQRPFRGPTATDLLAEIVKTDPDWDCVPGTTPARIRVLLWRCLQKDPKRRLRDIGEARLELGSESTDPSGILPGFSMTTGDDAARRSRMVPAVAAALLCGAVLSGLATWLLMRPGSRSPEPVRRFELDIGSTSPLYMQEVSAEVALSSDGRRIAYTASRGDGARRLYVRELGRIDSVALPGTEGAWRPFFSPDGQWIGFFVPSPTQGRLLKVPVAGGSPLELCDAFPPAGATWLDDGTIVFTGQEEGLDKASAPYRSYLFRVSEQGGEPEPLTRPDPEQVSHLLPHAAHGKSFFLFTALDARGSPHAALFDLRTGRHHLLLEDALGAQYAASGHLVFMRNRALWAATFDPASGSVGAPTVVQAEVQMNPQASTTPFAVSAEGSLLFSPMVAPAPRERMLVWVDHDGREETVALPPGRYWWPRVSPDGSRVAMSLEVPRGENEDIWIHRFERAQSMTRFTFEDATDRSPLWYPDGKFLYFASYAKDTNGLFRRRSDGTGAVETVMEGRHPAYPADITPDRTGLLFGIEGEDRGWDIFELRLGADGRATPSEPERRPVLRTQFAEGGTKLSPDGRWLAYNTNETRPTQVFVRPFPNLDDGRWQISTDGGINPTWSADGRTIYYRHGGRMMMVPVQAATEFRPGTPRVLFEADYYYAPDLSVQYDLEYPGRQRFLMMKELPDHSTTHLVYVGNWVDELSRLVPGA